MKTYPTSLRGARLSVLAFTVLALGAPISATLPDDDEAAIRERHYSYAGQLLAQDWSAIVDIRTEAAVFMPPNEPAKTGAKEILEWHKRFPRLKTFKLEIQELEGNGDLAVLHGRYTFTATRPDKSEIADTGKYLQFWRKQGDGAWKIERDIFNSDNPPAMPHVPAPAGHPSIVGTYKLVFRELPDGRMFYPPAINGMMNITPTMMNFNIFIETEPGKPERGAFLSSYQLTESEYRETRISNLWLDEDGKFIAAVPIPDRVMPVKRIGSAIEFTQPPMLVDGKEVSPPTCVYDGNSVVATKPGEFIDRWERVLDHEVALHARAGTTEPLMEGTWELDLDKSRFSPGPAPRSETRTYAMTDDGRQHVVYDLVDAQGNRRKMESAFRLDGVEVPITGNPEFDAQAITRLGPRTVSAIIKKDGKVVRTAIREVSEDGMTMTLRFTGVNAQGQPVDDLWFFERKPDVVAVAPGTPK